MWRADLRFLDVANGRPNGVQVAFRRQLAAVPATLRGRVDC